MLSIQYVYERVLLVFFAPQTFVLKAAAKVQLLFNPASLFEKKISFFLAALLKIPVSKCTSQFLAVWEGKDKIFFLLIPSLF
jgi:hypothetical protein